MAPVKDYWPPSKPDVDKDREELLGEDDKRMIRKFIGDADVILELGSWLGGSSRFMAGLRPDAILYCVDTWEGSPEHVGHGKWGRKLPTLFDTFLVNNWYLKGRLCPLRMTTNEGFEWLRTYSIKPDFALVDAAHDYMSVLADLTNCVMMGIPRIVGDDWRAPQGRCEVGRAAQVIAKQSPQYKLHRNGNSYALIRSE